MNERKGLPLSVTEFDVIRNNDLYYVDKTPFIYELVKRPWTPRLLCRPRRFGKSLLLDTMRCLYEGRKELFENTFIYDKWDWEKKYPVVKLDFSIGKINSCKSFNTCINDQLHYIAKQLNIQPIERDKPASYLANLVSEINITLDHNVVILIDEYDSPIANVEKDDEEEIKSNISSILCTIKSLSGNGYCKFVFVTGILNFAQIRFGNSAANSFFDISLQHEYNDICGYTQHDLETTFAPELNNPSLDKDVKLESLKNWYDGYNWSGKNYLYNPYYILKTFAENGISDYWTFYGFASSAKQAIKKELYINFKTYSIEVTRRNLNYGIDTGTELSAVVLFQSGFLTIISPYNIKTGGNVLYTLAPPNNEVRQALAQLQLALILNIDEVEGKELPNSFEIYLRKHQFNQLRDFLRNNLFTKFTYYDKARDIREKDFSWIMRGIFIGAGLLHVEAEKATEERRADPIVHDNGTYYICEWKVLDAGAKPGDALAQIKSRNYTACVPDNAPTYLLGFDFTTSGINCPDGTPKVNIANIEWDTRNINAHTVDA